MAYQTTSNFANSLTITYDREKYIIPHEQFLCPFYHEMLSFTDGKKPQGKQHMWFMSTGFSESNSYVTEGGDYPTYNPPSGLNPYIVAKEYAQSLQISTLMALAGQGDGTMVAQDIIDQNVQMNTEAFLLGINRATLCNSNTRIGVVEATVATSNTFYAALPQSNLMIRKNMYLDFYTGSSVGETGKAVGSVDYQTGLVTLASGVTVNATAGDGIYQTGCYGMGIYGLAAIVDNGTNSETTIFAITRSTDPEVNAQVISGSGGLQSWSQTLARKACDVPFQQTGKAPTEIWINNGIYESILATLTGNQMFTQGVGEGVPNYQIGADIQKGGLQYNGQMLKFRVDPNIPAQTAYFIHKPYFRKFVLREANWWDPTTPGGGSGGPTWLQSTAASGPAYASGSVAVQNVFFNMGAIQPAASTLVSNLSDALYNR